MPGVEVTVTNEGTNTSVAAYDRRCRRVHCRQSHPRVLQCERVPKRFKPVIFRNFVLQVGQSARLDIRLEVGNVEQTVEVSVRFRCCKPKTPRLGR